MVCDALKEIFADEWRKKELQFQEKETKLQEKETKFQEKELSLKMREVQVQKKEMQLKKRENRMETLVQLLLDKNLLEDLSRISVDKAYRELMYQKYGLE